ncbi:YVTN family beta-propeller repeat protein [Mycobacterium antarcticum]|uniref:YVTN family beta-propeller repeat protein n=1 Tax=unclassified Mycolicibacterium TaxID=2636767 RepID=UPI0024E0CEBE|nr:MULTISPECIES: beta-propeller fold lactonase family protein [unclassified Mycolicibacterium]
MGNATFIGRVGALAVALGIGTAVVTTPGVALAEPPSDSSAASESPANADSSSTDDQRPASPPDIASMESPTKNTRTDDPTGDPRAGIVQSSGGAHTSSTDEEPAASSEGNTSTPADGSEPEDSQSADSEPAEGTEPLVPELPIKSDDSAPAQVARSVGSTTSSDHEEPAPAQPVSVDRPAADHDVAGPDRGMPAAGGVVVSHQPVVMRSSARTGAAPASPAPALAAPAAVTVAQLLPAAPVNPLGVVSNVVSRVVSGLLAWVGFGPSMTTAPAAPVQSVGLLAVLAWVRREVQRTFFNEAPTIGYDAELNVQTRDGVVTGQLTAVDPDGDPLSLSLVEAPKYGSVVLNRDGTFTYTPSPAFARTGGTDEFTVMSADTGFHLHGPFGVFAPGFGHTTLVKASVNLFKVPTILDVGDGPIGLAVSPDGTTAYVANVGDGTVSVIDTATDTVTNIVTVGIDPFGVAVSPSGTRAYVTNFGEDTVSVIDTATNTVTATISVGDNPRWVAVSPDGAAAYVANSGDDDTVSVIDTATNTVTATITVGENPDGLAVSPDGAAVYVANALDDTVSVIDTATNTVTATITVGDDPFGVAVSPDGATVYVTNDNDDTVSVIDTATNTVTATITVGVVPAGVAVSPDGATVYVANQNDDTVSVIDAATKTVIATHTTGEDPTFVAVSPDGTRLYVSNFDDDTVSVLDASAVQLNIVALQHAPVAQATQTSVVSVLFSLLGRVAQQVQRTFFNEAPTIGYDAELNVQTRDGVVTGQLTAVDPDGDPLSLRVVEAPKYGSVVLNRDGTFTYTPSPAFARTGGTDEFTVMSADTGFHLHGPFGVFAPGFGHTTLVKASVNLFKVPTILDVGDGPGWVAISPDGATVYVTHPNDDTVSVIDTVTNTVVDTITVGDLPLTVVVSPNGATAYVNNGQDTSVSVIDTVTNTVIDTINVGPVPNGVAVSPDSAILYVTQRDAGTVLVIDTATNTVVDTITVGGAPALAAISPDGATLYVAMGADSMTDTVAVIDAATKSVITTISVGGPAELVWVSPDGTRVYVSWVNDSTVLVIDTVTNTVTATITVGNAPAVMAFSPDGTRAYVANFNDGTLSVIDTATDTVIATKAVGDGPAGVAVSANGTVYVAHYDDGTVWAIDLPY